MEYSYIQYSRSIIWEYSPEFHSELFPNILGLYHGNVPRIFHEHIVARWVDKACFEHDMAYGDFKVLFRRTVSDKVFQWFKN